MQDPIFDQVETTMFRYLAFWLAASTIASVYLGWAAFAAWLLSAVSLMTIFYAFANGVK